MDIEFVDGPWAGRAWPVADQLGPPETVQAHSFPNASVTYYFHSDRSVYSIQRAIPSPNHAHDFLDLVKHHLPMMNRLSEEATRIAHLHNLSISYRSKFNDSVLVIGIGPPKHPPIPSLADFETLRVAVADRFLTLGCQFSTPPSVSELPDFPIRPNGFVLAVSLPPPEV